jgi:hypothetical protein
MSINVNFAMYIILIDYEIIFSIVKSIDIIYFKKNFYQINGKNINLSVFFIKI